MTIYACKRKVTLTLTVFALILCSGIVSGQNAANLSELYNYSSKIYGTSDFLANGWKYYPEHFNATGNPYFINDLWTKGSVRTINQEFDNIELRYNIQMDELVISLTLDDGLPAFIMLNKDFIKSFTLNDHLFINAEKLQSSLQLNGYAELIYDGQIKFMIKHEKSFIKNYSANSPQGSFSGQTSVKYLLSGGKLNKIQSKKALLNLFPEYQKQIKAFMKKNKIRFKKAGNADFAKLMKYCDEL